MIKLIQAPIDFLSGFGINLAWFFAILGTLLLYLIFKILGSITNSVIRFMIALAPIWLPVVTFLLFFEFWLAYVRKFSNLKNGRITLEIKLPQEVFKSPEAMELALIQLHQKAAIDNHVQTYWDGKHPPTFGLEIVSREGALHFYINLPPRYKNQAESQLYAQYPGIQIHELELDYTAEIPWNTDKYSYFSFHFTKKEHEALPIKTYFEYGLHTMPKEEEKIDPITTVLEALASAGPGEHYWVQILASANIKKGFLEGSLRAQPDWVTGAKEERERIIAEAKVRAGGEDAGNNIIMLLTDGEKETIKAIERGTAKAGFNVAIRGMYIAEQNKFDPGVKIPALTTMWRVFDDNNRNAIGVRWRTDVNWPWWQDPLGKKILAMKKSEFSNYKKRVYYPENEDGSDGATVFTTEELATIFHLPGQVAITPTLGRIPSKTSEAPSNLPTG